MLDEFLVAYAKTYAFETMLSTTKLTKTWAERNNPNAPLIAAYDRHYKAIAVNIGNASSKVFDSVLRRKCPNCPPSLTSGGFIGCGKCKGTGYIEPYDLMITFVRRPDKLWNVSIYSTKEDVDCGAIAESFGGGGHKGAAGFQCPELPFDY